MEFRVPGVSRTVYVTTIVCFRADFPRDFLGLGFLSVSGVDLPRRSVENSPSLAPHWAQSDRTALSQIGCYLRLSRSGRSFSKRTFETPGFSPHGQEIR